MVRTKLRDRILPNYSRKEEIFNMISHIVGGALGVVALVLCVVFSAIHQNALSVVSSVIYGISLILLYTMSSIYHGLRSIVAKKVIQVIDHCTIYILIAGTYTPVLLCAICKNSLVWGWTLFGVVWGLSIIAIIFTAIDLKKYSKLSMTCYIGLGWCIVLAIKPAVESIPLQGLIYLIIGGLFYTVGAVLYGIGKRYSYMHSAFHIFVLIGSILHFFCIFFYII